MLGRTPRGRIATASAWKHLGLEMPETVAAAMPEDLFSVTPDDLLGSESGLDSWAQPDS
jgi:Holliday junction DNA helicase RuvB